MAVSYRQGVRGYYYGNDYKSSNPLTTTQMKVNAQYIFAVLSSNGWTMPSICALLGNMQAESTINPGRWQSDRVGGSASGHGYGLVQWTPYTKYTEWATSNGYSDPSEMDANISRILYEVTNNIQWIATSSWSGMSFFEFTQSRNSPSDLAKAFLLCYERPANQSSSVQAYRGSLADAWYEYLTGGEYVEPDNPGGDTPVITRKKKKGYKFLLFDRKRRYYG